MKPRPSIIILAAGQGSRFCGSPNRPAPPQASVEVLAATVANALQTRLPIVVVTTAALVPALSDLLATRDLVVLDESASRRGVGHVIAAGVAERASAGGWLVLPGDMPLVQPSSLLAVAAAIEQHPIAFAQHRGRRGHPVGFGAELFSELMALGSDETARRLVSRYPSFACEVDDPGVLVDVDRLEGVDALRVAGS
jgi:molybdenum cofactor cytidylyltransferase